MNEQMKKYLDKMNEISSTNIMDDDFEEKAKECARAALDYCMTLVGAKEGVNCVTNIDIGTAGFFIEKLSRYFFTALVNLIYAHEDNDKSRTVMALTKTLKSYEKTIFGTILEVDKGYEEMKKEDNTEKD